MALTIAKEAEPPVQADGWLGESFPYYQQALPSSVDQGLSVVINLSPMLHKQDNNQVLFTAKII